MEQTVKLNQNELNLRELMNTPGIRSEKDFKASKKILPKSTMLSEYNTRNDDNSEDNFLINFKKMLLELSKLYKEFPLYMIEITAENYGIPNKELNLFIKNFLKQGLLIRLYNYSFKLKSALTL